jgi:hypothetical protein
MIRNKTYEEYVTIDILAAAAHRLKRSEAGTAWYRSEVH